MNCSQNALKSFVNRNRYHFEIIFHVKRNDKTRFRLVNKFDLYIQKFFKKIHKETEKMKRKKIENRDKFFISFQKSLTAALEKLDFILITRYSRYPTLRRSLGEGKKAFSSIATPKSTPDCNESSMRVCSMEF